MNITEHAGMVNRKSGTSGTGFPRSAVTGKQTETKGFGYRKNFREE
jgi:hypothetical protein